MITEVLTQLKKESNRLATEDFSSVTQEWKQSVEKQITNHPYETLLIATQLGYGLGHLNSQSFMRGAIRIGKLLAMKSLSGIEEKANESTQHLTQSA